MILCHASLDVAFVIDTSIQDQKQFDSIKAGIKNVISGFSFNETGPRAALISFASYGVLRLPFELYENPSSFKSAVDLVPKENGERNISSGLQVTLKYLQSQDRSENKRKAQLVYLVTTGEQAKGSGSIPPSYVAESFYEQGVKILALGIGDNVSKNQLIKITRDDNLVRIIKDPGELSLKETWRNITMDICYASGLQISLCCFWFSFFLLIS